MKMAHIICKGIRILRLRLPTYDFADLIENINYLNDDPHRRTTDNKRKFSDILANLS